MRGAGAHEDNAQRPRPGDAAAPTKGSHGQSSIIDPTGIVVQETGQPCSKLQPFSCRPAFFK